MLASSFEHRFENLRGNSLDRDVVVQTANSELHMHINDIYIAVGMEIIIEQNVENKIEYSFNISWHNAAA